MSDSPQHLAQRQLDAYNARDLDAFLACYAEHVEVFTQGDDTPTYRGREAMRESYGPYFQQNPALHASLLHRIVQGRFVMDHEQVTGLSGGHEVTAIAIYEVTDGLIQRVWFIR